MMGNYNRRGEEGMGKLSQHRSQKTVVVYYLIKKTEETIAFNYHLRETLSKDYFMFENPSTTSLAQATRDASGKNRP
jgi:hypothetical protein